MSEEATLDEFLDNESDSDTNEDEMMTSLDQTSVGNIPADWSAVRLGKLTKDTLYGANESAEDYHPDNPRYIRIKDIDDRGRLKNTDKASLSPEKAEGYLLNKGDMLFARSGSPGRTYLHRHESGKYCYGGYSIKHELVSEGLNHEYISQYTKSQKYWDWIERIARTGAQANINSREYSSLLVPLPPLPEQRKIATVLYTVDQAIIKTEDILEKLRDTSSKVAQKLAISGIGHSEFEKVRLGPKQVEVPTEWNISKFGDLSDVQQGLQIAKSDRYREDAEGRYQYITVQYLNNPQDAANNWYIEEPRQTVICEKEDILMTRTGNTGEVITGVEGAFHNNFFKIQFDRELLLKDYLVHYLESKTIQDILISYAGTTTIPDLNHGEFFNIPVLIPPIREQKEISKTIESINNKVAHEEMYLNRLQYLKQGLMQDLLSGTVRTTDTNITVPDEVAQHG